MNARVPLVAFCLLLAFGVSFGQVSSVVFIEPTNDRLREEISQGKVLWSSLSSHSPIVFADSTLNLSDWLTLPICVNNSSTYLIDQRFDGGHTGNYRYCEHQLGPKPPNFPTFVWVMHLSTSAKYDPSISGALDSLTYSEDQIQFNPPFSGAQIGVFCTVRQNGRVYAAIDKNLNFSNTSWQVQTKTGIRSADFVELGDLCTLWPNWFDSTSHPDFSSLGSMIEFGCSRSNSSKSYGEDDPFLTLHGYDNWVLTLYPNCCDGTTGNVNKSAAESPDLSDLSLLISYLTQTPRPTLPCVAEANVNASVAPTPDLSDLSLLVAYLTQTPRPTLPSCP